MRMKKVSPYMAFAFGGLLSGLGVYTMVASMTECKQLVSSSVAEATILSAASERVWTTAEVEAQVQELATLKAFAEKLEQETKGRQEQLQDVARSRAQAAQDHEGMLEKFGTLEQQQQQQQRTAEQEGEPPRKGVSRTVFQPPPKIGNYSAVGLAAVADPAHERRFGVSLASQRCYAQQHGYDYFVLNPSDYPKCQQRDFFFRKHCAVARFLESRPQDYILFVLDGDNPMVHLTRNLDPWLAEARITDVVVYERWMNNEIMAGNYAVRNSAWGIKFCDGWASYDTIDQPRGYHSSDNGAIHLHVLRYLRINNHHLCTYLWERLSGGSAVLDQYFQFVACTRSLMGAPRRWKLDGHYRLTILPRGHSWSVDGGTVNSKISDIGPVSHHGQKTAQNYLQYFTGSFVDGSNRKCSAMMRTDTWVSKRELCGFMSNGLKDRVAGGFQSMAKIAPQDWDHEYLECMKTLSCGPLDPDQPLEVSMEVPSQNSPPFVRISKDMKFKECGKEHDTCKCVGIVKFGLDSRPDPGAGFYYPVDENPGQLACTLGSFDGLDPAPGAQKRCFCAPLPQKKH